MGTIKQALCWSGSGATLSMFIVTESRDAPTLGLSYGAVQPQRIRTYTLEDVDEVLGGRRVYEYDSEFGEVPTDLKGYVTSCLRSAIASGAEAAWFGFEGSFSFEFLLVPAIAPQVYGVADNDGVAVATDADLHTPEWSNRVQKTRRWLLDDG